MGAIVPPRVQLRGNDPESRLEFLFVTFAESQSKKAAVRQINRLREMKFPVLSKAEAGAATRPTSELSEYVLRWSDSLDRL